MPVDPYAVLQALLRAEASRARRTERTVTEPGAPAAARSAEATVRTPEPSAHRENREGPLR
ncbi:hypothetical protein ACN9M0_30220 [Streptomyces sp. R-07]|uniref:hypothetical protein n=1 Tax=unclassified Streptomyces TaxID=2593676 RepID=UPI00343ED3AF